MLHLGIAKDYFGVNHPPGSFTGMPWRLSVQPTRFNVVIDDLYSDTRGQSTAKNESVWTERRFHCFSRTL